MIKLGVIGDPIAHSLSPALHNFVLESLGIAGEYRAYHVREHELKNFLLAHQELSGFNVTIPHKERIARYLDKLSPEAQRIGAVNTVKRERAALVGYNTDSVGFLRSLQVHNGVPTHAILVGAGGAARAVAHALLHSNVTALSIYNRTPARALALADELRRHYPHKAISVEDDPWALPWDRADLVVNATPVGMKSDTLPVPLPESLSHSVLVYDLVYNPPKTKLLLEAERRGAQALSGLDMFIYQAIESLKIWLERSDLDSQIDYDNLRRFLEEQL